MVQKKAAAKRQRKEQDQMRKRNQKDEDSSDSDCFQKHYCICEDLASCTNDLHGTMCPEDDLEVDDLDKQTPEHGLALENDLVGFLHHTCFETR